MKKILASLLALCLALSMTALPAAALEPADAKELLRQYYVDGVPEEVLALDSLEDILEALGDPYTVYLTAEEYQRFLTSVNGQSVVGIGVSISTTFDNGFRVMSILPNSPALEAGLEAGDRIVEVDGQVLTAGSDIRALIGGETGTSVTVTVIRQSDGGRRDYTMTRRAVVIPIVTYETVGSAGLIDCSSFGDSTVDVLEEALTQLEDDVSVWIMDLRSNPGGTSNAAAGSAGCFVGSATMVYFLDAQGGYRYLYTTDSCDDLTDKPLIILTSPHSASGSELFAAAIRDHGAGISIGQRTFGKGIAQIILDESNTDGLFEGDALKVTAYRFFSPDGATNHIVGVLPTLMISMDNAPTAALLLSAPQPKRADGFLKLEVAGQTFCLDLDEAMSEDSRAAFTELLESLPPAALLYKGSGTNTWTRTAPADLAGALGLVGYKDRCAFSDLTDDLAEREQIAALACYGLVAGYEDGTFRPQGSITRAEFCALLANALNLPASEKALSFSDTSSGAWYAPYVSAMASKGFIAGRGDGTFLPNDAITYQEVVTILSAAAAWVSLDGRELNQEELSARDWAKFCDFATWAQVPARNLTGLGLTLDLSRPDAPATRAQTAGLLYQLMEATHLFWDGASLD